MSATTHIWHWPGTVRSVRPRVCGATTIYEWRQNAGSRPPAKADKTGWRVRSRTVHLRADRTHRTWPVPDTGGGGRLYLNSNMFLRHFTHLVFSGGRPKRPPAAIKSKRNFRLVPVMSVRFKRQPVESVTGFGSRKLRFSANLCKICFACSTRNTRRYLPNGHVYKDCEHSKIWEIFTIIHFYI